MRQAYVRETSANHPCHWTREDFSTSKCLLLPERGRLVYCSRRRLLLYTDPATGGGGERGAGKVEIFNLDQSDGSEFPEGVLDELELVDVAAARDEIYLLTGGWFFKNF